MPASVDLEKETVITGRVVDGRRTRGSFSMNYSGIGM